MASSRSAVIASRSSSPPWSAKASYSPRLTGNVFDANGRRLSSSSPYEFDWEIDNPEVGFTPCPIFSGAPLCVEFEPRKPTGLELSVDACFRKGICKRRTRAARGACVAQGRSGHELITRARSSSAANSIAGGRASTVSSATSRRRTACHRTQCPNPGAAVCAAQLVVCASGPCRFSDVSVGGDHTCAVDTNQDAWCWGDNYSGELGVGDFDPAHISSPVPRRVRRDRSSCPFTRRPMRPAVSSTNHEVFSRNNWSSIVAVAQLRVGERSQGHHYARSSIHSTSSRTTSAAGWRTAISTAGARTRTALGAPAS